MTKFNVTRLKRALRMAIETGNFSLPGLVDVVSNMVGLWLFIVSHLKETGKKDSGDSLVVWFNLLVSFSLNCLYLPAFCCLEKRDSGYFYINQVGRMKFRLFHLIFEMCWFSHQLSSLCSVSNSTCIYCMEILGVNV